VHSHNEAPLVFATLKPTSMLGIVTNDFSQEFIDFNYPAPDVVHALDVCLVPQDC
jgi:hypothetical protein